MLSRLRPLLRITLLIVAFPLAAAAGQLDVLEIPGIVLKGNPLGDPPARHVAVFKPDGLKDDQPATLVVYLPGWGGSSEPAIAEGRHAWFGMVIDQLAATAPTCASRWWMAARATAAASS